MVTAMNLNFLKMMAPFLGITASMPSGLLLGHMARNLPVVLLDRALPNHVTISSDVGGGSSALLESMLQQQTAQGRGWLYIDTRCDTPLLHRLAEGARRANRSDEFYVLNLRDPKQDSHTYSLWHSGTPAELAVRMVQALQASDNPEAIKHVEECCHVLEAVYGAMAVLQRSLPSDDLLKLLNRPELLDKLLGELPAGSPEHQRLTQALAAYRADAGLFDLVKLREQFMGLLGRFFFGSIAPRLFADNPEIVLSDILQNNKMCYVQLPVVGKSQTAGFLGRMLLTDLAATISKFDRTFLPARLRTPFLCVLQDVLTYTPLPGESCPFNSQLFSLASAQGISMVTTLQAWEDAKHVSPVFTDLVRGNSATQLSFRQYNVEPAQAGLQTLEEGEFMLKDWLCRTEPAPAMTAGPLELARMPSHPGNPRWLEPDWGAAT